MGAPPCIWTFLSSLPRSRLFGILLGSSASHLLDLASSPMNAIEFCVSTMSEMAGADVYAAVDTLS
jgi:hypothetical protein